MAKAKIGSPLFILRNECEKDLPAVLDKLSQIGYDGIEFLGFFGRKPSDIKNKLDSCGLKAIGDHVGFNDFSDNTQRVIDEHKEIGCGYITIGSPGADGLPSGEKYNDTIETYERIGEAVKDAGMKLLFHNHAEELRNILNGKTFLERLYDDTRSDLLYCEPDLGWIGIGGGDPEFFARKYKNRCPVIHFKDYVITDKKSGNFLFRPTGYGIMNNAELYALSLDCDLPPEWYVMDHDCAYERDIYFDMKISLEYFKNLMTVHDDGGK